MKSERHAGPAASAGADAPPSKRGVRGAWSNRLLFRDIDEAERVPWVAAAAAL